jgi:NO-binding membrane sensor protein with MHYT domain
MTAITLKGRRSWRIVRTVLGLVLAPAFGGIAAFTAMGTPDLFAGNAALDDMPALMVVGLLMGLEFGAIPALVIGWPLHVWLQRKGWRSVWVYAGLGAVIGVVGFFLTGAVIAMAPA